MTDTTFPGNYTASSGTITIAGGDRIILSGTASLGPSVLVNGGGTLLTRGTASVSGLTVDGGATLDDFGTVNASADLTLADATLRIRTGGTYNISGDVGGDAGSSGAPTIHNAGTLAKVSGSGVSYIGVTTVSSGTLSVADGNLRFTGTGNSFSGTYIGSGMVDYGTGSTSTLHDINMIDGACTTSFGSVNQAGTLTLGCWSTIKNLVGSTWNFTGNNGLVFAGGGGPVPTFTNKGYLDKTGGTGTTVIGIDVSNEESGVVYVATGKLSFNGASNMFSGTLTGAGTIGFGGGSTTLGAGTTADIARLVVSGTGTNVSVNTALTYAGGFVVGRGATVAIGAADTLDLSGTATLAGTLNLTGSGTSRAALGVTGSVAGTGSIAMNGAATVELGGRAAGQTVSFAGTDNRLTLDSPTTFGGRIAGFDVGDTVDLVGVGVKALKYNGTYLTATLTNGTTQRLRLSGPASGVRATSDGNGGTALMAMASSFTATRGADVVAFASGTNTVNATAATIGANDSFLGETGVDTLKLAGGGTISLAGVANFRGFERIQPAPGANYDVTMGDGNVAPGQSISVDASAFPPNNSLTFHGGAEIDGTFSVTGGAGNDKLAGGKGADTMAGGSGNDSYWVNNIGDQVIEAAGGGYDRVYAYADYTLGVGQSIESLSCGSPNGTSSIDLTGNEIAQASHGNAGSNVINGKGGNDSLTGGGGNDVFVFDTALNASANVDRITDFVVGSDMIELAHAVFQALPNGDLDASAFHVGAAAASASDHIIYNPANGALYYDSNGGAAGGSTRFATLSAGLPLSASDFKIV